ncbi:MAG: hypothetical protein PHQ53_07320 [Candidatus Krumholzibacteria bacterium]|nr:hypothetical protein [Candidatus Krumholzibacteria bacterium]
MAPATYQATIGTSVDGDAEYITAMYQLSGDCAGEPGAQVMFWVGASWDQEILSNPMQWNWILYTNLEQIIVTENNTWSSVKALFK